MYERFTDRARKVMMLANQEAQRSNHEYIDDGHILAALVNEGSGIGGASLIRLGANLGKVRSEYAKLNPDGPDMVTMGKLPQTPRCKKIVEDAIQEARKLDHGHVGTEHLALAVSACPDGNAAPVLAACGISGDAIRQDIMTLLGGGPAPDDSIGLAAAGDSCWKIESISDGIEAFAGWLSAGKSLVDNRPSRRELTEKLSAAYRLIGESNVRYEYELRKSTEFWTKQRDSLKEKLATAEAEIEKLKATAAGATP